MVKRRGYTDYSGTFAALQLQWRDTPDADEFPLCFDTTTYHLNFARKPVKIVQNSGSNITRKERIYRIGTNSTLLFLVWPSAVSFDIMGRSNPCPTAESLSFSTPLLTR